MNYYDEKEKDAAAAVVELLRLPLPDKNNPIDSDEEFDPWRLFPSLYGSYSSAFDNLAIEILERILSNGICFTETLAHEMFREMCCTAYFCSYGTSPRVCFATPAFREVLPALIDKWKAYRDIQWGTEE